jgi:RNA polymerase sigma factor (sigma-70 family)
MTSLHHPDWKDARENGPVNLEDSGIFEILYKNYWELLLNFAGRYISDKDTCKEIVQELFITLHLKRRELTIQVSLTAYLYSSIRNKIINHLRKESIYKKHVSVAGKAIHARPPINDIDLLMDANDLEKEIHYCLNKMSDRQREVYVLVKQEAYPLKKVADMLNRPIQTVEKQLRKAVQLVQAHLNGSLLKKREVR